MKLFYRKFGEGRPLIILHGLFGMSDNWMTLSKQFAEAAFCVYAVDARNHGRSQHSDEFNYDVMAGDILELMDDEKLLEVALLGHSMGGKTAMWLACQRPEKVSKLIVVDISPARYASQNQKTIEALSSIDLSVLSSRKEVENKLRILLNDEATIQFLLKNLYWNSETELSWRFNLEVIKKNIVDSEVSLPISFRFEGPSLFLKGERSNYIKNTDETLIKQHFPQAIIETIPNSGHWIHADNPAAFMQAAIKFLN